MVKTIFIRLMRDHRGAALVEFVFVLPIFLLLVFAGTEFGRYLLIQLKVQSASYAMANIVSQYNPSVSQNGDGASINLDRYGNALTATLDGNALNQMLAPFGASEKQGMIITSVRNEGGVKRLKWQVFLSGTIGGVASVVNGKSPGAIVNYNGFVPDQPASFDADTQTNLATMLDQENLIVVEVFYRYTPLTKLNVGSVDTNALLGPRTINRVTFLRPRNGDLICLPALATTKFIYPADCPIP